MKEAGPPPRISSLAHLSTVGALQIRSGSVALKQGDELGADSLF